MTKFIFFSLQSRYSFTIDNIEYQHLKRPLEFSDDPHGISNWVMRFPLTVYSIDLSQKHCFTEDNVTVSKNNGELSEQRWNYFVITKNDGSHLYCTSQLFFEKGFLTVKRKQQTKTAEDQTLYKRTFYLPKCLVLVSEEPYFKMHVNLVKIYRQIQKQRPNLSHPIDFDSIQRYFSLKNQNREEEFEGSNHFEGKRLDSSTIYHFYMNQCRQHSFGESILIQKSSNLPVLHLYKLRQNSLFQFSHFFHLTMSNKNLINILTAILLEKQIILTGKNSNLLVMLIESLLQLLKPLKWQHMLVHHLPSQLVDAVNQSFLPYLVGISSTILENVEFSDKFVLFVEQDRFYMPTKLPSLGNSLEEFTNNISNMRASYSNEKVVLQNSIEFMCKLLKPIVKLNGKNLSNQSQFYQQFLATSLYESFIYKMKNSEMKQVQRLINLENEEQKQEIKKQLNRISYYNQNPAIKYKEAEWIQYYTSKNKSSVKNKANDDLKMPSLQNIKQTIKNEANHHKMIRKMASMQSRSSMRKSQIKTYRNGQKLQVSRAKHEQGVLLQFLQEQLGIDPRLI